MNVAPLSVRRRVVTILVLLGILLLDLFFSAIERRHVDSSPILVSASLPGASPETMEASVAMLLERQFLTIAGLVTMTSMNNVGSTEIVLQFNASRNIDSAAQDVQAAIARSLSQLPSNMPQPPSCRKMNRGDLPILSLLSKVDESVATFIAQSIAAFSGGAQV